MTGQSNDAAERSAHVTRGAAGASDAPHPVVEWRNADGQTVACARGVAELRAENARLQGALDYFATQYCEHPQSERCGMFRESDCVGCTARAALTPRPPRADAAPAGWDDGSNVR